MPETTLLTTLLVVQVERALRDVVSQTGYGRVVLVIEKGEVRWLERSVSEPIGSQRGPPLTTKSKMS